MEAQEAEKRAVKKAMDEVETKKEEEAALKKWHQLRESTGNKAKAVDKKSLLLQWPATAEAIVAFAKENAID